MTQVSVRGKVSDSVSKAVLSPVSIENLRTHQGCFSNAKGEFTIEAELGDFLIFTHVGYNRKVVSLKVADDAKDLKVYMTVKTTSLSRSRSNGDPQNTRKTRPTGLIFIRMPLSISNRNRPFAGDDHLSEVFEKV
ncbi:hypothetical protein EMGBS15_08500 [Filimonas sp.]|nr:hypothetical protein EMGBS15_08500 [Filimonas sp.]